jgi:hypothetical protein
MVAGRALPLAAGLVYAALSAYVLVALRSLLVGRLGLRQADGPLRAAAALTVLSFAAAELGMGGVAGALALLLDAAWALLALSLLRSRAELYGYGDRLALSALAMSGASMLIDIASDGDSLELGLVELGGYLATYGILYLAFSRAAEEAGG